MMIYVLLSLACVSTLLLVFNITNVRISDNLAAPWVWRTPELTAQSWVLFEPDSGYIYRGKESGAVLPIASLTKLFTAYVASNDPGLEEEIKITWADLATEGRAGKLEYDETYTMRELLFPLLLESSNDAGAAIRRTIGENVFNERVRLLFEELSLENTAISDASGLSEGNVSSAEELAQFLSYVYQNEPHILDITQLHQYVGENNGWINNNPAHTFRFWRGGKHGYTPEAGRTFAGFYELANGRVVGVIFLGSSDLEADISSLQRYLY